MTYQQVYEATILFGGLFLLTMWGAYFFWFRFKKKDDAQRKIEHRQLALLKGEIVEEEKAN